MENYSAMTRLQNVQRYGLIAAGIGLLLTLALTFLVGPKQFFEGYLMAYFFVFGLSIGSLALVMIHHLAGGRWSFTIRRPLEAAMGMLPLTAGFFLVILNPWGLQAIYYRWFDPTYEGRDDLIIYKVEELGYLTYSGFAFRAVAYFAIWFGLAYLLYRFSGEQDKAKDGDFSASNRLKAVSGVGLVLYVLTMTLAAVDWGMSIEPHFYSAIYGVLFMVGQGLSVIAVSILLMQYIGKGAEYGDAVTPRTIDNLGKMLLAFTILWTYVSYAQYIIIWSGNIPEFTPWYISRSENGWQLLSVLLIIFHFAVPFFILLQPRVKRSLPIVAGVAAGMIIMRLVDIYWLIAPDFYSEGIYFNPIYLTALVMMGGAWVAAVAWMMRRRSLLPVNEGRRDPRVNKEVAHA